MNRGSDVPDKEFHHPFKAEYGARKHPGRCSDARHPINGKWRKNRIRRQRIFPLRPQPSSGVVLNRQGVSRGIRKLR